MIIQNKAGYEAKKRADRLRDKVYELIRNPYLPGSPVDQMMPAVYWPTLWLEEAIQSALDHTGWGEKIKHTILIPGTWGGDDAWFFRKSSFIEEAKKWGVEHPGPMFPWSYDIDWFKGKHADWLSGGRSMGWFLVAQGVPHRPNVIAHSHGGQVALYAAASGVEIETLVTVATPVRRDMRKIRKAARPNIKKWVHLHSDSLLKDYMQVLGSFADGYWGIVRKFEEADENIEIPGATHTEGLLKPSTWTLLNMWKYLGGKSTY